MEAFPPEYIAHDTPLIVLSGLRDDDSDGREGRERIPDPSVPRLSSTLPLVDGDSTARILHAFKKIADERRPWNANHPKDGNGLMPCSIKAVGREYQLPARKAGLPPLGESDNITPSQILTLHSPISPLSPASPLYPDGIMTPEWVAKHQSQVPAIFVLFFTFSSDSSRNSVNDNQLKSEINSIKATIASLDYKTRLAVVLIADGSVKGASDADERLSNIRKACGLDLRSSFFVLPSGSSPKDVDTFAISLLATLQPIAVEYYRDLTKHTRRKKNRGNIPPPTVAPSQGTLQTLDAIGWSVRYDFKLGVFAEFRQEMESALRHYQSALEQLLGPDGFFETTASRSPRWNEARLLADTLAIRILRCLLWNFSTTLAAQSWTFYRDRMRELIDRRGKGSDNYAWQAWEATWAKVMAQLIERAGLPSFEHQNTEGENDSDTALRIYAPIEKTAPVGERIPAWFHLHHPGYWYKAAYKHATIRRRLATALSDDERKAPESNQSRSMLIQQRPLDIYLCPEPYLELPLPNSPEAGFDHYKDVTEYLETAILRFEAQRQRRTVEKLQLELAIEHMRRSNFIKAHEIVEPLWRNTPSRSEGWWQLVGQIAYCLREYSRQLKDVKSRVATTYELCSEVFTAAVPRDLDLMQSLDGLRLDLEPTQEKVKLRLMASELAPVFECSATFASEEGNAGEPSLLQLSLSFKARQISKPVEAAKPVRLSRIDISMDGISSNVKVLDVVSSGEEQPKAIRKLNLAEHSNKETDTIISIAHTDLSFSTGQTMILEIPLVFREAGEVGVAGVSLVMEGEAASFELAFTSDDVSGSDQWHIQGPGSDIRTRRTARETPSRTRILPRPPKMEISLLDADRKYYTDEPVQLDFELFNGEDEDTEATLEVRMMSRDGNVPTYQWVSVSSGSTQASGQDEPAKVEDLPGHVVGLLATSARTTHSIAFTAPSISSDIIIEVRVLYHLFSNRETPISKVYSAQLTFASAFEANYDFTPRVHSSPWPSFFSMSPSESTSPSGEHASAAAGITQRWRLSARLASFAEETLAIEDISLNLLSASGKVHCTVLKDLPTTGGPVPIAPKELHEHTFTVDVTKPTLEDRHSSTLETSLTITWRRAATSNTSTPPAITTTLPIPPMLIPTSEPQVLLTASPSILPPPTPTLIHLDYTLENPSMHFLTFDLTMEANELFAFSGAKLSSVNLVPLSRTTVRFNVLPLKRGVWVRPELKILDRYFGRSLRAGAAGGCRGVVGKGKEGGGVEVWVDE